MYEQLVPLVSLDFGISFLLLCVTSFNFFFLSRLFNIDWGGQNLKIRRRLIIKNAEQTYEPE